MLLVGFIYFGMYFLSDVSPIHNLPSTVLASKTKLQKSITSYHGVASVLIFEIYVFLYTRTINFYRQWFLTLQVFIAWGWFSIQSCNSMTSFHKGYFHHVHLVSGSSPRWKKTVSYHNYLLKELTLRYMYFSKKQFSE